MNVVTTASGKLKINPKPSRFRANLEGYMGKQNRGDTSFV
jgi:hypothetical protein